MRKIGMGCLSIVLLAIAAIVAWLVISGNSKDEQANQEIEAVVKALDTADDTPRAESGKTRSKPGEPHAGTATEQAQTTVNLEKTVRLFHILDAGYGKSHSMQEYLHFLATQDYRGIPQDVIEAKKKIIPYYKAIRKAEDDLDEAKQRNLWKAITNTENLTSESSPIAAGVRAIASGGLDIFAVSQLASQGITAGKNVYENLLKNDELEKEAREILEQNQEAYLAYLEEYTRVYSKYMAQWNRLCLMRDQAYIAIENDDMDGALTTLSQVLADFPGDQESILLKAYCLVRHAQQGLGDSETRGGLDDVSQLLGDYIHDNPERTAPALVLLGAYHLLHGDTVSAKNMFDQSSMEYPRQAETLLDMYNSYNYRNYLTKSVEGHFVQSRYKSMMEGFGFFSPNFQKAIIAYDKGEFGKAKEEIFKHFFRRGNQEVYDYLIADMKFVERHMPLLLNMIFEEHSFLDLETYNPTLSFSDKLAVIVENRSDKRLSNVRLFLCLHLTDMYKNEYQVKKMETTISNIEPHSKADFGKLTIDYDIYGKKKDNVSEIVNVRAIIMTDSLIIWVDEDKVKRTNILNKMAKRTNSKGLEKKDFFHMGHHWNGKDFIKAVHSGTSFEMKEAGGLIGSVIGSVINSKKIVFHFPRILDGMNPYFSFGQLNKKEAVMPASVILNGDHIDVEFDKRDAFAEKTVPLYISSADGTAFYMDVTFDSTGNVTGISDIKF